MSRGKGRQRWHCHACEKTAFGSESRAEETMGTLSAVSTRQKKPKRAYPCPYGNGWHMTSQEART
jgi:hypothetical protein